MALDARSLVARFRSDPKAVFAPEELAALADAAPADIWAAKVVAVRLFLNRDYEGSLRFSRMIVEREPTAESVVNLVVTLRELKRLAEAVEELRSRMALLDGIVFNDLMCSLLARLGRLDEAVRHGDEALRLKDERTPKIAEPSYALRRFDPETPRRNVIAFSVWGADIRYLQGAINNAVVARYLYPGWTARFYTDTSTPQPFRETLQRNAAEVVVVDDLPARDYGLFWRFLIEDDEDVDVYLVRDADSVLNIKERWAVADWLQSGKAFHVLRDDPQHSELILAGMWGAHRGNIGAMRQRIATFCSALPKAANDVHKDQHFLRNVIWPIVRGDVLIHDRCFNFMSPRRYDPGFDLPKSMHIGQNDWVHYKRQE